MSEPWQQTVVREKGMCGELLPGDRICIRDPDDGHTHKCDGSCPDGRYCREHGDLVKDAIEAVRAGIVAPEHGHQGGMMAWDRYTDALNALDNLTAALAEFIRVRRSDEIVRARIASAVAAFAWDDFGLDNVAETIRAGSTEWVAALSARINDALDLMSSLTILKEDE